jgi:predicted Zn-ribbon and HTH transcriptional regulator
LHYELHRNISLQRRVTLEQADQIYDAKVRIAELEKMLEEAQGMSLNTPSLCRSSDFQFFADNFVTLNRCVYLSGHYFIRAREHAFRPQGPGVET